MLTVNTIEFHSLVFKFNLNKLTIFFRVQRDPFNKGKYFYMTCVLVIYVFLFRCRSS